MSDQSKEGDKQQVIGDDIMPPHVEASRSKVLGPAEVSSWASSGSSSTYGDDTTPTKKKEGPVPVIRDQRLVRCAHTIVREAPIFAKPTICDLCSHHLWVWQGKVRTCSRCEIYLHEQCFQELVAGLALVAEGKAPEAAFLEARKQYESNCMTAPPVPPPAQYTQSEGATVSQPQWFGTLGVAPTSTQEPSMLTAGLSKFMAAARSAMGPTTPSPPATPTVVPVAPPSPLSTVAVSTPVTTDEAFAEDPPDEDGSASPMSATNRFSHVHGLLSRTAYIPTTCSVCGYVLVGPCYCCKGCDYTLHLGCLSAIPASERYEVVAVERSADDGADPSQGPGLEYHDRSAEPTSAFDDSDPNRDALLGDAVDLVKRFHKRNSTWSAGLNPLRMRSMYNSHSEIYCAAVESLNRLRDSTGALLATGSIEMDSSVMGSVKASGISKVELTTAYHILRYATAMYGMAYSEGYMSSIGKATVMRLFRRNYLAPKDELNNMAVMEVLALPRNDLKYSRLSSKVLEPSYGLIQDRQAKGLVLAFRGSLTDADFLSDAYGDAAPFCGGVAHEGIAHMARMASEDAELMGEIRRIMAKRPEYRLYITGHSLGAALAMLFTILVRHENLLDDSVLAKRTHTFCYAPPPCVTIPLADKYDSFITSFVAGDDVVCRLQLNTVDRLAGQAGDIGRASVGSVGGAARSAPAVRPRAAADIDDNLTNRTDTTTTTSPPPVSAPLLDDAVAVVENEVKETAEVIEEVGEAGDITEELHIAGTIYFMTDPLGKNNRLTRVRRTHTILHQIFISPSMVNCHLMDSYAGGLKWFVDAVVADAVETEEPLSPTAAAMVAAHAP